ncbi:class I SAM-dependent methyltransferase [Shewanella fodinae]|uniref:Putative nicotinamide N-methyase n=1 Tax=Shewanella fodinae TaxID=552357 RepID=A0A4R2EZF4_9GAMM|nr:histidine kinase [Shewanella fodinae]TCN76070.1 putative nicotinamide N-methyase [Shewanella fodinae]
MASLRFCYQTLEFGDADIHLRTLRDNQQYADTDGAALALGISSATWPLFGIVWPSGNVLAHLMCERPIGGLRILEVGCGIALASLVLNQRHADITATDYHPEAGNFLRENVLLNHGTPIPFKRTGWADGNSGLGVFDLIIGSDLLYEAEHAELLSTFIEQHAAPHCHVIIVDPGRGNHARFSKKMQVLGYSHTQEKPQHTEYLEKAFKGVVLTYQRLN